MGSIEEIHRIASPIQAATKLRRLLENSKEIVFCPGVYDGFSARIAASVGFDALYMVCSLHITRYPN